MGMKDKGGRAFTNGNALMSAPHDPKRKVVANTLRSPQRKVTQRASRCTTTTWAPGAGAVVEVVQKPKGYSLMGW